MHYRRLLRELHEPFSVEAIAEELGLKKASAIKLCQRYVKEGHFIRLRRNLYVFQDKFVQRPFLRVVELSAEIKPETYISFRTALRFHGVIKGSWVIEAAGWQKSFCVRTDLWDFAFFRFPKKYCFSTIKKDFFEVATPEKALLDILYLKSFGRYRIPIRVRRDLLSKEKMLELAQRYPKRTQRKVELFWKRSSYSGARVPGPKGNGLRREVLEEYVRF